jgi:hypothetical protein
MSFYRRHGYTFWYAEENDIDMRSNTLTHTCILVECLREANKILFLDGEGNLTISANVDELLKRDEFQRLLSHGLIVNEKNADKEQSGLPQPLQASPAPAATPAQEEPARTLKAEKDDSELKLLKGDTTLYLFYFSSIGKPYFVLWVMIMFLVALTERFPGE